MTELRRSRWIVALEAVGVALFAALLAALALRLTPQLDSPLAWTLLLSAAPLVYLLADFASGMAH